MWKTENVRMNNVFVSGFGDALNKPLRLHFWFDSKEIIKMDAVQSIVNFLQIICNLKKLSFNTQFYL